MTALLASWTVPRTTPKPVWAANGATRSKQARQNLLAFSKKVRICGDAPSYKVSLKKAYPTSHSKSRPNLVLRLVTTSVPRACGNAVGAAAAQRAGGRFLATHPNRAVPLCEAKGCQECRPSRTDNTFRFRYLASGASEHTTRSWPSEADADR